MKARADVALAARATATIERTRERLGDLAQHILDIAADLRELDDPRVAAVLGHASFDAVCRAAIGIAPATARRWMEVAERDRRFVLDVGVDRARALVELSEVSAKRRRAPEVLNEATLTLPSGKRFVVRDASNEQIDQAARAFRQAQRDANGGTGRGFTTTAADRKAQPWVMKANK